MTWCGCQRRRSRRCSNGGNDGDGASSAAVCCAIVLVIVIAIVISVGVWAYSEFATTHATLSQPTIIATASATTGSGGSPVGPSYTVPPYAIPTIVTTTASPLPATSPPGPVYSSPTYLQQPPIVVPHPNIPPATIATAAGTAGTPPPSHAGAVPNCGTGSVACYRPHPPAECPNDFYVCGVSAADCYGCPLGVRANPAIKDESVYVFPQQDPLRSASLQQQMPGGGPIPVTFVGGGAEHTPTPVLAYQPNIVILPTMNRGQQRASSPSVPRELITLTQAACASPAVAASNYCYLNAYKQQQSVRDGTMLSQIHTNVSGMALPRTTVLGFSKESIAAFLGFGTRGSILQPPTQGCVRERDGYDDPHCMRGIGATCCNTNLGLAPLTPAAATTTDLDAICTATTHHCLPCAEGTRPLFGGLVRTFNNTPTAAVYTCARSDCGLHASFNTTLRQCVCDPYWGGPQCSVAAPAHFARCDAHALPTTNACQTPGSKTECAAASLTEHHIWANPGGFALPASYPTARGNKCTVAAQYCDAMCTSTSIAGYTLNLCQCTQAPKWW